MERLDKNSLLDNIKRVHAVLKQNLECCICMEVPKQISRTQCGHFFCQDCINKLVKDKRSARCPICNSTINRRTVALNDEMSECAKRLIQLSETLEDDFDAVILAECGSANAKTESSKVIETLKEPPYNHVESELKVSEWLNKDTQDNHYNCQPSTSSTSPTLPSTKDKQTLNPTAKVNETESTSRKTATIQKPSPKDESMNQGNMSIASIDKKWSVVKKFGKEMRPKRKTKSLNVVVEPAKKSHLSISPEETDNNSSIVKKRGNVGKRKLSDGLTKKVATVDGNINLTVCKEKSPDPPESTRFDAADENMVEDLPAFPTQAESRTEQIAELVLESNVVEKDAIVKPNQFNTSRLMNLSKKMSPKKNWLAKAQETEISFKNLNSSGSSQTHTTTSSTEITTLPQTMHKNVQTLKEPETVPTHLSPTQEEGRKSPLESTLKTSTKASRNRLSLGKTNQLKRLTPNSPIKHDLVQRRSTNSVVQFHKLGRMLKQKKMIPFHYCGNLRYSLGRIDQTGMGRQFYSFCSDTTSDICPDSRPTSNTTTSLSTHFSVQKNISIDKSVDQNQMDVDENKSDFDEMPGTQPITEQPIPNENSKSTQESIIHVQFLTNSFVASPVLAENQNKQNTPDPILGNETEQANINDGQQNSVEDKMVDSDSENIHAKKRGSSQQSGSSTASVKFRTKKRRVLPLKDTPPDDFDNEAENDIGKDSNSDKSSRKSDDTEPITVVRSSKRNSSRKLSSSSGSNASSVVSNDRSGKRKRDDSPPPTSNMEEIAKAKMNNWCKNLNSSNRSRASSSSPSVRDSADTTVIDATNVDGDDRMDITDDRGYNILNMEHHPSPSKTISDPKLHQANNVSLDKQRNDFLVNNTSDNFDRAMGEVDTQFLMGEVPATPTRNSSRQDEVQKFVSSTPVSNRVAVLNKSRESPEMVPDSLDDVDQVQSSLVEDTVIHVSTKQMSSSKRHSREKRVSQSELSMVSQINESLFDKPRSAKKMKLSDDKIMSTRDSDRDSLEGHANAMGKKVEDFEEDSFNITQNLLLFKQLEAELLAEGASKKGADKEDEENVIMETPNINENDDDIVEGTPQVKKKRNPVPCTPPTEPLTPTDISPIPDLMKQHQALITPIVPTAPNSGNLQGFDNGRAGRSLKSKLYHSTPKISELKSNNFLAHKSKSVNQIDDIEEETSLDRATVDANEQRLCFVCSGLQLVQIDLVKRFADSIGATYQSTFSPQVTHVIVKCKEDQTADNTLKYLQGIAYRKWVVGYNWVLDCKNEQRLLPEDKYEVVESTSLEPGPKKSRLRDHDIFEKFSFLCLEPYVAISVDDCKNLIVQTGGTIAHSLEDLASMNDKYRIIVIQEDTHDESTIDKMASKARAIPVSQDWVTESISQYGLMPLPCYIQVVSIQHAERLDFPKELLEDDDEVVSSFDDRA